MTFIRCLLGVLVCCLALASPTPSMAAADPARGAAAFTEGRKLFAAGDYRGALVRFKDGYAETQDPAFLLNMGQCHRSLGEKMEALSMFRRYLASSPEGSNPSARAIATKSIHELESETRTAPSAPTSAPPSVVAEPAPAAASASQPKFTGAPGGLPVLEPAPELDAAKTAEAAVTVPDDTAATVRHLRITAITFGAVGLVAIGTGVYYYTRANSLSESANKAALYNKADYDDGKRAEKMQWICYGAGAAAMVTAAGLLAYSQWFAAPKKTSVALAPIAAPGTAGLAAVGSF